jgi:hypothetical protein
LHSNYVPRDPERERGENFPIIKGKIVLIGWTEKFLNFLSLRNCIAFNDTYKYRTKSLLKGKRFLCFCSREKKDKHSWSFIRINHKLLRCQAA